MSLVGSVPSKDRWTPSFYGLSHLGELLDCRRVSVQVLGSGEAILTKFSRTEGSAGSKVQRTRAEVLLDTVEAAKFEGERWIREGDR